mmetsp:Transcript_38727/g.58897  ORF Transcript_38727/g.58897 Transcript_38727/m.58897 type:complete len:130 (-) Transcript_38727:902-1291(-)
MSQILENSSASLGIAQSSVKLLEFNVEDILALPQLKQGKFTSHVKPIDLSTCVNEVIALLKFKAEKKELDVCTDYIGFDNSFKVPIDELRFQQILLNYLSNALKFTERGGRVKLFCQLVSPSSSARSGR